MRRAVWWILGGLGGVCILLGLLWFGYGFYVQWVVARSPATLAVIRTNKGDARLGVYSHGDQVAPLDAATPEPAARVTPLAEPTAPAEIPILPLLSTATPSPTPGVDRPILPPTRVEIPKIGVDAAVVAGDENHLPQFKGVGWYIGSGYPGFRGNMVLFGHLNGVYETFGRLNQLVEGDTVRVTTAEETYTYKVTRTTTVPENAVSVLAPSTDHRLTLITCEGVFIPATRDYTARRVVIAALVQ